MMNRTVIMGLMIWFGVGIAVSLGEEASTPASVPKDVSTTSTVNAKNSDDGSITITQEDLQAFMKKEGSSGNQTSESNSRPAIRPNNYQRESERRPQRDQLTLPSGDLQIKIIRIESNDSYTIASCELTNASDTEILYWKLGADFNKSFSQNLGYASTWGQYLKPQSTVSISFAIQHKDKIAGKSSIEIKPKLERIVVIVDNKQVDATRNFQLTERRF